jgi:DNA-directed RNA polymerase II subunit RPB2
MESEIFIGPTYYMRLKHMVKDKINYRARGPRTLLTRQTVQGRANDGGLRVGEMERDGIASHGLSHFLQESLLVRGDEYYMAVCNLTGMICIYNSDLNLFMSPMADGPIKFSGNLENGMSIDNITQYGRTFSIVRVPYALKLLIQELQAMNIQIRIITDKNIDQITSMGFNKSIESIEQPVVKKIKKDKKIKLGQIEQQPQHEQQPENEFIEQLDKQEPIEQVEEAQQDPEIQPEEPEVEAEIKPLVQEQLQPELDIEEPQDNITNIPLINKNLNKMEDIIEGKPIVSILEGGKYNKHDEYVKEEFKILGDLDEEEGEKDGEEEYKNNSKTRSIEFN